MVLSAKPEVETENMMLSENLTITHTNSLSLKSAVRLTLTLAPALKWVFHVGLHTAGK